MLLQMVTEQWLLDFGAHIPNTLEEWGMLIARIAFYIIVAAITMTWLLQIALKPKTRTEVAEFCKITAFFLVVWRQIYISWSGNALPPVLSMFFWVTAAILVGFYLWVLLDDWGGLVIRSFCSYCVDHKWVILLVILTLALTIYLGRFLIQ
jgi:hypothetical protein